MRFDIITIFPRMVEAYFKEGIVAQGVKKGKVEIVVHDLRDFGLGKHKQVDDRVFGGGSGMLMMFEPAAACISKVKEDLAAAGFKQTLTVATTAGGEVLKQSRLKQLQAEFDSLIILCGRYEGYDQRILNELVDLEISLGKFVLSGGEIAAIALVDGTSRLLPGVLGKEESFLHDSFYLDDETAQYPQYTRPETIDYHGKSLTVPPVLLSGNHAEIAKWREENSRKSK